MIKTIEDRIASNRAMEERIRVRQASDAFKKEQKRKHDAVINRAAKKFVKSLTPQQRVEIIPMILNRIASL